MASFWTPSAPQLIATDRYRPSSFREIDRYTGSGNRKPDYWRPGGVTCDHSTKNFQQIGERETGVKKPQEIKIENSRSKAKRSKTVTKSVKSNPNREPLGKRQISSIVSIIRSGEQVTKLAKANANWRVAMAGSSREMLNNPLDKEISSSSSRLRTGDDVHITRLEEARLTTNPQQTYLPILPKPPFPTPIATREQAQWSRTRMSGRSSAIVLNRRTPSPCPGTAGTKYVSDFLVATNPRMREEVDSDERIDQCLMKMDKWADAWLAGALVDEDRNNDPNNAWESFEYCLSMPDVLEEGEIIEHEEVSRREMPVAAISQAARIQSAEHADSIISRSTSPKDQHTATYCQSSLTRSSQRKLETSVQPSNTLSTARSWKDFRQTKATEFRSSSSPEPKRVKILHIPSAATLREEARIRCKT